MNHIIRTLALPIVLAAAVAASAADRLFVAVDYMHIPENSSTDQYIALEKLWQRLHQKAVDAGICRGWYLDRVENGGRNQFVTIRIYDSLDKAASPWNAAMQEGLFSKDEQAIMQKTQQIRDLTHSELWELESSALKEGSEDVPAIVEINFMKPKPGKGAAYYDAELKVWQRVHKARIDAGQMTSWYFLSRFAPTGTDSEYDFITANAYPKKEPQWDTKVIQSAVSKEELEKVANVDQLRTLVRAEIWHPMLKTTPRKK